MGVSWSSPKPTAATFLLGPMGFPCWVPAVRQKPRGLPLPIPCLLSRAWAGPPGTNCQGSTSTSGGAIPEGCRRRRKRKSGWHLPSPDQFPLQCPPVVAAHFPTCHAAGASHCGVPSILRLMVRTGRGPGWSSSHPQVLPLSRRRGHPLTPPTTATPDSLPSSRTAFPFKL